MKPPLSYLGAKTRIAPTIVTLLPTHRHYIEPFAGSMAVLLAKPISQVETVNDIDGDLMTFWRVLRDHPDELERACQLTPHSRSEYYLSLEPLAGLTDIERARRVWVRVTQGSSRTMQHAGMWAKFVTHTPSSKPFANHLRTLSDRIKPAAARIADVSIDSRPASAMVQKYGRERSNLLYLDPPYLGTTRTPGRYLHEMTTVEEHEELLTDALACRASVVISGYASALYDSMLSGWERYEIPTRSGGRGTPSKAAIEVLWIRRSQSA